MNIYCVFSVWYLSFYCDPRIQQIVVCKILMEGINATAVLYGGYAERYIHTETFIQEDIVETIPISGKG